MTLVEAPMAHLGGQPLPVCRQSCVLCLQLLDARELSTPVAATQRMLSFQSSQFFLDPKQPKPSVLLELAPSSHGTCRRMQQLGHG
jgi:hypothetical protein